MWRLFRVKKEDKSDKNKILKKLLYNRQIILDKKINI